jgi:hypothetical protein
MFKVKECIFNLTFPFNIIIHYYKKVGLTLLEESIDSNPAGVRPGARASMSPLSLDMNTNLT